MTDEARCEPPEGMRDVDGWHWMLEAASWAVPEPVMWVADPGAWRGKGSAIDAARIGVRYIRPIPTPEVLTALITALDRIAHMHRAEALIAIAALHKYDPSRRVLNNSPLPAIDTTIKPPAKYYPERQS